MADLAFFTCFWRNKNCLERLDVSIWSGSVTRISPFDPILIIAKFLSNSQPIAPAPITNVFSCSILCAPYLPTTIFKFLNYSPYAMNFFSVSDYYSGSFWIISLKWKEKNWRIGIYLFVIAFIAYWDTIPPK